jgi:hypothetical protein
MTCHMLLKVSMLLRDLFTVEPLFIILYNNVSQLNKLCNVKQDMITYDEMERLEGKGSRFI